MTTDDKLDLILEIVKQHDKRFDQIDKRFEHVDDRFKQIDKRFEQIDKRFEQIDKRFEQIDNRFEQVDKRFDRMDKRFDRLENEFTEVKYDLRVDSRKLDEVYEKRDHLEIRFSKIWFGGHALVTACIAFIVSFFTASKF